jgi:hypothetical protein
MIVFHYIADEAILPTIIDSDIQETDASNWFQN